MMHGWTEPSSTLHPYAFAIAPHNRTDPMGANANTTMTNSANKYQNHGNLLWGLPFTNAIPNNRLRVNIVAHLSLPALSPDCFNWHFARRHVDSLSSLPLVSALV